MAKTLAEIDRALEKAKAAGDDAAVAEINAMRDAKIDAALAKAEAAGDTDAVAKISAMRSQPAEAPQEAPQEAPLPGSQGWEDSVMARGTALLSGLTMGWGEQVAAGGRTAVGQILDAVDPRLEMEDWGTRYERERDRGEQAVAIEQQNNPLTMAGLTVAGAIPTSLKNAAMVGTMPTRLGNVVAQAGLGTAEGLSFELGKTRGDLGEKIENIDPINVGIGTAAGGVGGAFMSGTQGQAARAERQLNARDAKGNVTQQKLKDEGIVETKRRRWVDDLYTTVREEVGETQARTLNRADYETMQAKQGLHAEERLPPEALDQLADAFANSPRAHQLAANAGAVSKYTGKPILKPENRVKVLDEAQAELAKTDPQAAELFGRMRAEVDGMQAQLREIFPKVDFEEGYLGIKFKEGAGDVVESVRTNKAGDAPRADSTRARTTGRLSKEQLDQLYNPVATFMEFYEDTVDAVALARAYGVQASQVRTLNSMGNYSEAVIEAIRRQQVDEIGEMGANRLADNLKLWALNSREGMHPLLSFMRTVTSSALLGTPENAVLQLGDLGASAYATSFTSAIRSLPLAIRSILTTSNDVAGAAGGRLAAPPSDFIRAPDLGISMQHLGELVNASKGWGNEGNTVMQRLSNAARTGLEKGSRNLMGYAGVRNMNRMGQETLINASVNQMKKLDFNALAKSKYAEGLTDDQVMDLYNGLRSGDLANNEAVKEAAFFSIARMQPISRSAQTAKYLDMTNGRILYSMKQYMVKMGSKFQNDVLKPYANALEAGFQTKEGQALLKQASLNAVRYSGYIVALNAVVDPGRKEILRGKESENGFGEEFVRQGTSLATAGVVDLNQREYAMPPAIEAGVGGLSMIGELTKALLTDDHEWDEQQLRKMSFYIPGYRQLIWGDEVLEENF